MSIKKRLLMGAAVAVSTAGVVGLGVASAAPSANGQAGLVDKIATTFNLNKGEVQGVFDQDRAAHRVEMVQSFEESLDEAVADGKITSEQKAKILAKHAELQQQAEADRGTFKDKTKEEVRAIMHVRHEALKQWAEGNNIPMEYLMVGHMGTGVSGPDQAPSNGTAKQPTMELREGESVN